MPEVEKTAAQRFVDFLDLKGRWDVVLQLVASTGLMTAVGVYWPKTLPAWTVATAAISVGGLAAFLMHRFLAWRQDVNNRKNAPVLEMSYYDGHRLAIQVRHTSGVPATLFVNAQIVKADFSYKTKWPFALGEFEERLERRLIIMPILELDGGELTLRGKNFVKLEEWDTSGLANKAFTVKLWGITRPEQTHETEMILDCKISHVDGLIAVVKRD